MYVTTGPPLVFLSDAGGWQRWLFTIVAVGFSTLLTVWLRKQSASLLKLNLAYTLVIGGALGNLVDRLMHGFVVDFIDFFFGLRATIQLSISPIRRFVLVLC